MTSCTTTVQKTGGEEERKEFNCKQAEPLFVLAVSHVWVTNCCGVLRNLHSITAHAHYRAETKSEVRSTLSGISISIQFNFFNLCHTTWVTAPCRCSCRTLLDKFLVDPEASKVFKSLSYPLGSAYNNVWVCFVSLNPETLIVLWTSVVALDQHLYTNLVMSMHLITPLPFLSELLCIIVGPKLTLATLMNIHHFAPLLTVLVSDGCNFCI